MTMLSNLARKLTSDNGASSVRAVYAERGYCEFYEGPSIREMKLVGRFEADNPTAAGSLSWVFENKGAKAARKWAAGKADIADMAPWLAYVPMLKKLETALIYAAFIGGGVVIGRAIVDLAGRLA